jgi:putative ABC transport system permease protein
VKLSAAGVRQSLSQFRTNPLRTFLTLLGMVFGVGSVVAMVSIGEGAQREILHTIEAMGAASVHVKAKPVDTKDLGSVVNDSVGVSRSDATAIGQTLPGVTGMAYRSRIKIGTTDLKVPVHALQVLAVSADLMALHGLKAVDGRGLSPLDHERRQRVAVLGHDLAERAFPEGAVGRRFRLDSSWFEVVGVLAKRGSAGRDLPIDPQVYDDAVLLPFETAEEELRPPPAYGELDLITVGVADTATTLPAKIALLPLLKRLHGGVEDFEVFAPEEVLRQRKAAQSVLNIVLVSIAAISLVVGGIGVMNIMLANIMERIGEIGLRRALGARKRDIRNQFLLEAVLICFVGGTVGIVLGNVISFTVAWIFALPIAFAWISMLISFALSAGVGVLFGLIPALRAADVDPIEALHRE